jgi:hopanoid C-3 methylase
VKILLVQPPPPPDWIGFRRTAMPEPLALETIGAVARVNHDVQLLDMRFDPSLEATLEAFQPDAVAVTCLTTEVYSAQDVLRQVKRLRPETFTITGGLHASLIPEDFQAAYVDALVIGEGELTFQDLLAVLDRTDRRPGEALAGVEGLAWRRGAPDGRDNEWVFNKPRPLAPNIDSMPIPARDLTSRWTKDYFFLFESPHTLVSTSRGCPFKCNFCSVWKFYHNKCRYMSAERVVDELEALPTTSVSFVDDNFLANVPRAFKIAELIKKRGVKMTYYGMQARTDTISKHPDLVAAWREIGLETILIGFEAASQARLDSVSKGATLEQNERAMDILNELRIHMWGAFIVDPQFTKEDFQELKSYRERKGVIYPQFTILTPLPGTDLYRERYNELVTHDYRLFDALHAVLPTRLPREEFYKEFASLYRPDNAGLVYDWISSGRITMQRARQASKILKELGVAENFLKGELAAKQSPPAK